MRAHFAPFRELRSGLTCYAVIVPYHAEFQGELTRQIREWSHCRWQKKLKMWQVDKYHTTTLMTCLLNYFPREERGESCVGGRPCEVWAEKDRWGRTHQLGYVVGVTWAG